MTKAEKLSETQVFITRELQKHGTGRMDAMTWRQEKEDQFAETCRLTVFQRGEKLVLTFTLNELIEHYDTIHYYTSDYKTSTDWYKHYNLFLERASEKEYSNLERFVVIKEAVGNLCATLLILGLVMPVLLSLDIFVSRKIKFSVVMAIISHSWSLITLFVIIVVLLKITHDTFVKRQCDYLKSVVTEQNTED
jgi:hypothetical protein